MISLWWLGLSVLALPLWWHRQQRRRVTALPLATARFLPASQPQQLRVWRWLDRVLLLVRCLLLASLVAWLADAQLPWRGDTVLIAPGTDPAWAAQQVRGAGFTGARQMALPGADAFGWLRLREREWQADARLLVLGTVSMPAALPQFRQRVELRSHASHAPALPPAQKSELRVAIVGKRASSWRALFAAIDGPRRYVVEAAPGPKTELIVWDSDQAPAQEMRAPLWWVVDASAFPELKNAPATDGLRYADSARGRLWSSAAWPPRDADAARALFETWQRLHYAPVAFAAPPQVIAGSPSAPLAPVPPSPYSPASGALRELLMLAMIALFALERSLTHARRN